MFQLEVDNITAEHPNRGRGAKASRTPFAIRDVSFHLRAGDAFGIVGPSGCGKSTLAAVVAGLLTPDAGAIRLNGVPLPPLRERRSGEPAPVQMLFQNYAGSLDPRMTVRQILVEGGAGLGTSPGPRELLVRVGLPDDILPLRPHRLSGGQLQRIALARALAANPQILIADEPTSALDVLTQARILQVLSRSNRVEKRTLILISHDVDAVASLCPRLALMQDGMFVRIGATHKILSRRATMSSPSALRESDLRRDRRTVRFPRGS